MGKVEFLCKGLRLRWPWIQDQAGGTIALIYAYTKVVLVQKHQKLVWTQKPFHYRQSIYTAKSRLSKGNDTNIAKLLKFHTIFLLIPAVFSSSKENPLPSRCLTLYLKVGHFTTGLRAFIGFGAMVAAFFALVLRLRSFRAGWLNHVFTYLSQSLWKCAFGTIWLRFAGILKRF